MIIFTTTSIMTNTATIISIAMVEDPYSCFWSVRGLSAFTISEFGGSVTVIGTTGSGIGAGATKVPPVG